jgi:hypothetical protein
MVTRIGTARYLRVAGFAVGAVLIAGIAVVATASAAGMSFGFRPTAPSSQPSSAQVAAVEAKATSSVCSDFMKNFAIELKKSQAEINAAFQKAIADTLADEVKNKQITQAQADQIKTRLANQTPCTLPSTAGHKPAPKAPAIGMFMQQYLAAAASALGLSASQLQADLKAGQSLSEIAKARNVSETDFRTKLAANLKPSLDAAVSNKTLTSAEEQSILAHLQTGELPLWNAHRPKPTPSPAAT